MASAGAVWQRRNSGWSPGTARRAARLLGLALATLVAAPSDPAETDPAVVRLLPPGYPVARGRVDARQYPWRAVGRVTVQGGGRSCTGTLVGDRYVLTAAHCVWRQRNAPGQIHFLAGFQQDGYVAHARATRVHLCPGFEPGAAALTRLAHDCAVLELTEPIGQTTGYLGWTPFDRRVLADRGGREARFTLSGYRGDRLLVQTVDPACRLTGFTAADRLMTHNCPITGGDSGGPILLPVDAGWLLVGLTVGRQGPPKTPGPAAGRPALGLAIPSAVFGETLAELGIARTAADAAGAVPGRAGPGRRQTERRSAPATSPTAPPSRKSPARGTADPANTPIPAAAPARPPGGQSGGRCGVSGGSQARQRHVTLGWSGLRTADSQDSCPLVRLPPYRLTDVPDGEAKRRSRPLTDIR